MLGLRRELNRSGRGRKKDHKHPGLVLSLFTTLLFKNVILLGAVAMLGAALHVDKGSRARGHEAGRATDRPVMERSAARAEGHISQQRECGCARTRRRVSHR